MKLEIKDIFHRNPPFLPEIVYISYHSNLGMSTGNLGGTCSLKAFRGIRIYAL